MKNQIKVCKIKSNGYLVLTVGEYRMTYIGYSTTEAIAKFWEFVKKQERKAIRQSLKNIY